MEYEEMCVFKAFLRFYRRINTLGNNPQLIKKWKLGYKNSSFLFIRRIILKCIYMIPLRIHKEIEP